METRNLVRAIIYDDFNGERNYLLIKTVKGYWQNVQGGIEAEESESDALIREIKEETNLDNLIIHSGTRLFVEYDTARKGKPIHTNLAAYAVKGVHTQEIKLCSGDSGHTDYKWVNVYSAWELLNKFKEQRLVFLDVVQRLKDNL